MKFLFITDTHIKGINPRNRKDNFYQALKLKLNEIKDISDSLGVDYILHGGDWFDRPDISPAIVRDFAIILKSFSKPIYTVAGNHDIYGHNPSTVGRTMLGLLEGIGLLNLLNREEEVILEKDGIKVQLTGSSYSYDIDTEGAERSYVVKKRKDVDYAINIVHGMLMYKPFIDVVSHTLISDVAHTEADITFAGHYHTGFGIIKIEEKYFINPGSISRVSNSVGEIKRIPQVILAELKDRIYIDSIDLKSALPGEAVLNEKHMQSSIERDLRLKFFFNQISKGSNREKIDLSKIVDQIAVNQEIDQDVKDELVKRIYSAKEEIEAQRELQLGEEK